MDDTLIEGDARLCDKCGDEIQPVRDAFIRITYPTALVTYRVCRKCANELRGTMRVEGTTKPPGARA